MFDDNRSKRIILVAHCILNQNSISYGTADFPSQFLEILRIIEENHIGIVQLPCPELMCLGLDRKDKNGASRDVLIENSRIRKLMELNMEKIISLQKNNFFLTPSTTSSHLFSDYQKFICLQYNTNMYYIVNSNENLS